MSASTDPIPHRLVLLGASNLTRGLSTVIESACLTLGSPVEVLAALGHGRSYGLSSAVLGRALPAVVHCGLWQALDRRPRARTYALITDVGNDIMYGAQPPVIGGWVEACLRRLLELRVAVVLTLLPMESLLKVRPWQYETLARILFPGRGVPFAHAMERAAELNDRLRELATRCDVATVSPSGDWYGFDPIHIKRRQLAPAWARIFSAWPRIPPPRVRLARGSLLRWLKLRTATPERWSLWGWPMGRPQPSRCLKDGSTVSLY